MLQSNNPELRADYPARVNDIRVATLITYRYQQAPLLNFKLNTMTGTRICFYYSSAVAFSTFTYGEYPGGKSFFLILTSHVEKGIRRGGGGVYMHICRTVLFGEPWADLWPAVEVFECYDDDSKGNIMLNVPQWYHIAYIHLIQDNIIYPRLPFQAIPGDSANRFKRTLKHFNFPLNIHLSFIQYAVQIWAVRSFPLMRHRSTALF